MKRMMKRILAGALTVLMALSLAACGGGDGQNKPSGGSQSGDLSAGKSLIVGLQGDPSSFNPTGNPDDWGYYVAENLFSRLMKLNWKGEPVPDLAESVDLSEDGLTYTFRLYENAKWHDGEPVTASDVKWTFDKIQSESAYLSSYLLSVESVEAADEHTVVFHMSNPDAALLSNIAFLGAFILPEHIYANEADWLSCEAATTAPVGSGPFKFVENKQGVSITLEANADFYGHVPAFSRLVYQIIPDSNTAVQAFNNGDLDVLGVMVTASQADELESAQNTVVLKTPTYGRYYYGYNVTSPNVSDVKVREALTLAVDRQEVVDKAWGSTGKLAEGYYSPVVEWAYNADARIPDYDAAKAEQLLQEAGLTKGSDGYYLTLTMITFNLEPFTNVAQILQANLEKVGVKLVINTMDVGALIETGYSGQGFDLYALGGQVGPDPSMFYHRIGSQGSMNFSMYANAEVDDMFAQAAVLADQDARAKIYKEIQDVCAREFILVPLSEDITVSVYKDYLDGLPYQNDQAAQTEMSFVTFTREP